MVVIHMARLTERQMKLAENLAKGMKQVEAFTDAGYSPHNANKNASKVIKGLRRNPAFVEYERKLIEPVRRLRRKSVEDIHDYWYSVIEDPEASEAAKLKASELIAKASGMFHEKLEVEHKMNYADALQGALLRNRK